MRNTCGFFSSSIILLILTVSLSGQDTLRTYGPRIGIDLSRIAYLFTDPPETAAEISLDAELFRNIYPVIELGYSRNKEPEEPFEYRSSGVYTRVGMDYNLLPVNDRSMHHIITFGFRYGLSIMSQRAENVPITSSYWGDYTLGSYESSLTGHWLELAGGVKAEVVPNLFLGWMLRYRILLNPEMDPLVSPRIIPGYGKGTENRGYGFTYSISYKIPLIKK